MRVQSLDPDSMKAHLDLYMSVMFGKGGITRRERELIGTAVSAHNNCSYCISHHAMALKFYWKDENAIVEFVSNYKTYSLTAKDRAMIDYSIKLTENPSSVIESDIEKLWNVGFSDEEILNINMVTGYFNFVNRLVSGLGVDYTKDEVKGYKY